jgi:hypothetical protein
VSWIWASFALKPRVCFQAPTKDIHGPPNSRAGPSTGAYLVMVSSITFLRGDSGAFTAWGLGASKAKMGPIFPLFYFIFTFIYFIF